MPPTNNYPPFSVPPTNEPLAISLHPCLNPFHLMRIPALFHPTHPLENIPNVAGPDEEIGTF